MQTELIILSSYYGWKKVKACPTR